MRLSTALSHIMTTSLIVASKDSKLSQLLEFFRTYRLHHLPVTDDDGKLVGIISINDIYDYMAGRMINNHYIGLSQLEEGFDIEDLMTNKIDTLAPGKTVADAVSLFREKKYHSIPVTDGETLKGIVTSNDIMNFVAG